MRQQIHPRKRLDDMDPAVIRFLGKGFCYDPSRRAEVAGTAERIWPQIKTQFLLDWAKRFPCTRPAMWWHVDASARRRCTSGIHPHDNQARQCYLDFHEFKNGAEMYFGKPKILVPFDGPVYSDWRAVYESEFQYLQRLGLLLPGEQERVEPAVVRPDE